MSPLPALPTRCRSPPEQDPPDESCESSIEPHISAHDNPTSDPSSMPTLPSLDIPPAPPNSPVLNPYDQHLRRERAILCGRIALREREQNKDDENGNTKYDDDFEFEEDAAADDDLQGYAQDIRTPPMYVPAFRDFRPWEPSPLARWMVTAENVQMEDEDVGMMREAEEELEKEDFEEGDETPAMVDVATQVRMGPRIRLFRTESGWKATVKRGVEKGRKERRTEKAEEEEWEAIQREDADTEMKNEGSGVGL